jgi:hypothetical protein
MNQLNALSNRVEYYARDVVDLTWEILRWLRLRITMVEIAMPDALERILEPLIPSQPSETKGIDVPLLSSPENKLVKKWMTRNPAVIKRVDHFIANTERRRNAVLREIDRRRSTFAHALRKTVQDVEKSNKAIKSKPSAQRIKRKKIRHG